MASSSPAIPEASVLKFGNQVANGWRHERIPIEAGVSITDGELRPRPGVR